MANNSAKASIQKGSKSFYLSSLVFSPAERLACWKLYGWCRACDDLVDLAPNSDQARLSLAVMTKATEDAVARRGSVPLEQDTVFNEFGEICLRYAIPVRHPLELIKGFAMDVEGHEYATIEDVELYGYRVAGVVGLMVSHITGLSTNEAYKNAVDMGVAMQLTNIARDVFEDAAMGRVYLPQSWLKEEGVEPSEVTHLEKRQAVYRVVIRLLNRADELYASGRRGLPALPLRASLAVSAASEIYQAIGTKIRKRGPESLCHRNYVGMFSKFALLIKGCCRALTLRNAWGT